jgi:hypothetical protein
VELALIMVEYASARRIWDIFMEKKWESKIQLAQKQILKKIKKKRYFLVNGSREGIEKVLLTMITSHF